MAGTPDSPVLVQRNHSSWSFDEPSTVQNANLSDTMPEYAFDADMMPVDPLDSIFSEKMPVVEGISSQALSWLQNNTPANIDGDANWASFEQEGCLAAPCLQNNTSPSVFAAAPRNLASFEQESFNQDFAGVANEGKAEKLCVKRQGRKRPTVYTTNGDIMSQLTDMRTEIEKLNKEVEEMQNRLIKMDSKQNHKFKTFEELLVKMFDKMKQVALAVCNNKAHCCSDE